MSVLKKLILFFAGCVCTTSTITFASDYSQPGFYEVEQYRLDNGMRVILKPRHNARNVSIYLMVNIGHMNFPCGKRETAHFLEHLLFTGTTEHSEIELQNIIESHGGSWNAETAKDYTAYYVDIYSKHINVALDTLYEIITRSTITPENVENSRKIIYREDGGKPSNIRSWLYENEIIIDGVDRALNLIFPSIDYQCIVLDNTASITRDEILQAYKNYYVAGNMNLVVVGDFDSKVAGRLIKDTFGSMTKAMLVESRPKHIPGPFHPVDEIVESRWDPVVGSEASVYLLYRTGGVYSGDYYALTVLENYFQTELYNRIRVEQGMAYAPTAYTFMHDDYGAFVLETDSELDDIEENIQLIKSAISEYKAGHFDQAQLDAVKQKILLNVARGYESNNSFAEYYALSVEDLNRFGKYENYEEHIEKVTLEDIRKVSNIYFNDDNLVTTVVRPTFTFTQFYLLFLLLLILLSLATWRIVVRIRKQRSN